MRSPQRFKDFFSREKKGRRRGWGAIRGSPTKVLLQVRLELTTSALLGFVLLYKYRALTDCATGALTPTPPERFIKGSPGPGGGRAMDSRPRPASERRPRAAPLPCPRRATPLAAGEGMRELVGAAALGEGGAREQGREASGGAARTKPSQPGMASPLGGRAGGRGGGGRARPPPPPGGRGCGRSRAALAGVGAQAEAQFLSTGTRQTEPASGPSLLTAFAKMHWPLGQQSSASRSRATVGR